jgi:hypothetical protein
MRWQRHESIRVSVTRFRLSMGTSGGFLPMRAGCGRSSANLFARENEVNSFFAKTFSVIIAFAVGTSAFSQNPADIGPGQNTTHQPEQAIDPIKGFNAYENFRGMIKSSGTLLKLDSTVGYDFNRYFGAFAGVPLYFASDSSNTPGQTRLHDAGAGDLYLGLDAYVPNRHVDYSSTLTFSTPTGNVSKGFSPGKATVDWNNHLRHKFGRLAPFVAGGVGNTVPDSEFVSRDFISLGKVSHFEEGAEFEIARPVYLGGSVFQVVPFGNQQVFNRLDTAILRDDHGGIGGVAQPSVPAPFARGSSTSGNDLTREHGFDAWLGFEPTRIVRVELGYSRSITFASNSLSFNLGLNVGKLLRWQH